MSEHAARMEREIRDINSSLDKKSSELEVSLLSHKNILWTKLNWLEGMIRKSNSFGLSLVEDKYSALRCLLVLLLILLS